MAKNVQIIPVSGSLKFTNTAGNEVFYSQSGDTTNLIGDSGALLSISTDNLSLSSTARFNIPTRTPTGPDPEGTLGFEVAKNSLAFRGNSSVI